MNLFDVVGAINDKKDIDRAEALSVYAPFMINRALSMHGDTIFYANEMNARSQLDKDMQFDFYMNIIPKGKRFGKWAKAEKVEEDITNIMTFYSINRRRAEEILSLFSDDLLKELKDKMNKGGNHGAKRK